MRMDCGIRFGDYAGLAVVALVIGHGSRDVGIDDDWVATCQGSKREAWLFWLSFFLGIM